MAKGLQNLPGTAGRRIWVLVRNLRASGPRSHCRRGCPPAHHAATLAAIAETNAEIFYRGNLSEKISAFFRRYSGFLSADDLASFKPEWVEPVKINYRGYDVWEIPPNGQGIVALMAINILRGFEFAMKDAALAYHQQIEAVKLAFADGLKYIADIRRMRIKVSDLLSDSYAAERRNLSAVRRSKLYPENLIGAAPFTWPPPMAKETWCLLSRAIMKGLVPEW